MQQVYPTSGLWILMLALYHSQMRYHMIKLNKRYVFLCFEVGSNKCKFIHLILFGVNAGFSYINRINSYTFKQLL